MSGRRDDAGPKPLVDVSDAEHIPSYIFASGIVLAAGLIGQGVVLGSLGSPLGIQPMYILGVLVSFTGSIAIVAGGYWLGRTGIDSDRYRRIFAWFTGGLVVAVLVVIPSVQLASVADTPVLYWLHVGMSVGGAVGLAVGLSEARAIERVLADQRVEIESAYRQRQRSFLKHLHALVRHEVLNTTQVISGHATNRLHHLDEDDTEYDSYRTIDDQSRSLAAVVEDVEMLLQASDGVTRPDQTTNLTELLERELAQLRTEYPDTDLELSGDDDNVFVRAHGSVATVFGYLIGHRIEGADSETGRVTLRYDTTGDTVTITIIDDGPSLPSEEIHSPFEQPPEMDQSHGWALYLTDAIIELYDGHVDLGPSGPAETTIAVELPGADPPRQDVAGESSVAPANPKELF